MKQTLLLLLLIAITLFSCSKETSQCKCILSLNGATYSVDNAKDCNSCPTITPNGFTRSCECD